MNPVSKRDDLAVLLGDFLAVPIIGGNQDGIWIFQGNGMIKRIEQMLAGVDGELGRPSKNVGFVGRREFHGSQLMDIVDRGLRSHAS